MPTEAPGELFVDSLDALGLLVGISRQALAGYCSRGMPKRSRGNRTWRYPVGECVRWLRDNVWRIQAEKPEGGDPLMTGDSSPELERYRKFRADEAEIKVGVLKKQMVPRERLHNSLSRMVTILRGTGDQLQRQFGADAATLLDSALDDCDREILALCGDGSDDALAPDDSAP